MRLGYTYAVSDGSALCVSGSLRLWLSNSLALAPYWFVMNKVSVLRAVVTFSLPVLTLRLVQGFEGLVQELRGSSSYAKDVVFDECIEVAKE